MLKNGQDATRIPVKSDADQVTEYLHQRFFILPIIGGIFGFHHTRWWSGFTYIVLTVFYMSVTSTFVTLSYSSYLNQSNSSVFSGCLHITITALVVAGASSSLLHKRKEFIELQVYIVIEQNFCEYQQSDSYFSGLEKKSDNKLRSLLFMWLSLYGCSATIAVVFPFVDVYLGYELTLSNTTDVYWRGLPFTLWWPLDADNSNLAWITCFMSQGLYAFFAAGTCSAGMLLYASSCESVFNHIELLIYSLGNLDKRASTMFRMTHPGKSPKNCRDEYDDCYYTCIVQNIKHHQKILMAKNSVMKLASIAIGVPFFGGALLLGLAGINLLSHDDPRIAPKLFFTCIGVSEAAQMFLLCRYGERFQDLSEGLFNATFHTRCYRRSMKCLRAMMIFRLGATKPLKMTAAHLIVLNMETFSNLVNSAYSIFNLQSVTAGNG